MTSRLEWRKDFENLEDGDDILTDMKHGIISGRWDKENRCCKGYYWQDMSWYAEGFILMTDLEQDYN